MVVCKFLNEDCLLETESARQLYHDFAEGIPIVDFHCHLPPEQIARDHRFRNLAEAWLSDDHYKWRAMRTDGVPERYCTDNVSDWEKFEKWCATLPHLLRNPLYYWTHLELKRYFGIDDRLLGPETADATWEECNAKLAGPDFSCRSLLRRFNVVLVCTTDDPTDTLEHHEAIASDDSFQIQVLPAWRPDKALLVGQPDAFNAWVDLLAEHPDVDIRDFAAFFEALRKRHDFFHQHGCRLSDHGLERLDATDYTQSEIDAIFRKVRAGKTPSLEETVRFRSAMLHELAVMDHEKGWTQQFHIGALGNNNSRRFAELGPNKGFDSIGDSAIARPLSKFLDRLDRAEKLTKTILYNLNPRDNALMATMAGNFQNGSVPGKMQFGSAWWFLDQKDGIERQLETLSQMGVLGRFVGMVTDSRSFLSFPRHEYFRRILCNILGSDMEKGLIPGDMDMVGGLVRDVSYNNAAHYFGFDLDPEF